MMHEFYANGGTQDVDAWTIHIYRGPPERMLPDYASFQTEINNWATVRIKPSWMTEEAAWINRCEYNNPDSVTMAGYMGCYALLNWSQGASRMYW
jgi:hypothetical protein